MSDRTANLLERINASVSKHDLLNLIDLHFPNCHDVSCSVASTRLTDQYGDAYPDDRYGMTIAQELQDRGYSIAEINDKLQAIADKYTEPLTGGRRRRRKSSGDWWGDLGDDYCCDGVDALVYAFNSKCAGPLADLNAAVSEILGGDTKDSMQTTGGIVDPLPTVQAAVKLLEAAEKTRDNLVQLKGIASEEKKLAKAVIDASDVGGIKTAFKAYRDHVLGTLVMVAAAGQNVVAIRSYLKELEKKIQDTATVAASSGAAGGRKTTPTSMGGRVQTTKGRIEAIKTALLAGDVKFLAMLDMLDVDLATHERALLAQTFAGSTADTFENNVHAALGGRGVHALRVAGLL